MSKDEWFAEYERIEAERPDLTDAELADLAHEALVDRMADRADALLDADNSEEASICSCIGTSWVSFAVSSAVSFAITFVIRGFW